MKYKTNLSTLLKCLFSTGLFFHSLVLITGCNSHLNEEPTPPPIYLKISGGDLEGKLWIPEDGLAVGNDQFFLQDGKVGIGTSNPLNPLTVDGIIQSTTGGIMFPDGSTQVTAAPGSCFGGICAGNTTYSGKALFKPSVFAANDVLVGITSGTTDVFSVDAEGDVRFSGSLTCPLCIDTADIALSSVTPDRLSNVGSAGTVGTSLMIPVVSVNSKGLVTNLSQVAMAVLPASGTAGGDLTGNYPSPTLLPSGVTAGSFGSAYQIPIISVNAKGLISHVSTIAIGALPASGTAGGDLTGNYPSPTLIANGVSAGSYGAPLSIPAITVNGKGLVTSLSTVGIGAIPISGTAGGALTGNFPSPLIAAGAVTTSHLSAGANNSVLGVSNSGTVEWQNTKVQYGLKFEYVNTSTLRLKPSGIDGRASVLVASGADIRAVTVNASLTADLAASGAGGLDTGAEAASTGYDVYLITQNAGAAPALLLTVTGSVPTLPAGYTFKSEVLWYVSNSQGGAKTDIAYFVDLGNGLCRYMLQKGIRVLNKGQATAITAVNFSGAIPSGASHTLVLTEVFNLDVLNLTGVRLYYDVAGSILMDSLDNLLNTSALGVLPSQKKDFSIPIYAGVSGSLFYSFTFAPLIGDFGMSMYVREWTLPSRMMR